MNIRYAMEFTQTISREHGLTESNVFLLVLQLSSDRVCNVTRRIALGIAESEEEANLIVDRYLQENLNI